MKRKAMSLLRALVKSGAAYSRAKLAARAAKSEQEQVEWQRQMAEAKLRLETVQSQVAYYQPIWQAQVQKRRDAQQRRHDLMVKGLEASRDQASIQAQIDKEKQILDYKENLRIKAQKERHARIDALGHSPEETLRLKVMSDAGADRILEGEFDRMREESEQEAAALEIDKLPFSEEVRQILKTNVDKSVKDALLENRFSEEQLEAERERIRASDALTDKQKQDAFAILDSPEAAGEIIKKRIDHENKLKQMRAEAALKDELEKLKTPAGLSEDETKQVEAMRRDTQFLKVLTHMGEIQAGYDTAIQGYIDAAQGNPDAQTESESNAGFSLADMAMINGFQRMIDPGVSVHEGDVSVLLGTAGLPEELKVILQRVLGEGGRFSNPLRHDLAALIISQYNSNVRGSYGRLTAEVQRQIDIRRLTGKVVPKDIIRDYPLQTLTPRQILEQGHGGIPRVEDGATDTTDKKPEAEKRIGGMTLRNVERLRERLKDLSREEKIAAIKAMCERNERLSTDDCEAIKAEIVGGASDE